MLNEAETHKIIDEQLKQIGWEADFDNLCYSKDTRPKREYNIALLLLNGRPTAALSITRCSSA